MSSDNSYFGHDMWSIIQGLNGVNEKLLKHPGVAHIPSMLGNGEVPVALTSDGGGKVLLATNHRFVEIDTSIMKGTVQKVQSHPYQEIVSFEADKGFLAVGFKVTTQQGAKSIAAQKNGREEFASVVNSHLQAPSAETSPAPEQFGTVAHVDTLEELQLVLCGSLRELTDRLLFLRIVCELIAREGWLS